MLKFLIKLSAFLVLTTVLFMLPPILLRNITYENSIMAVLPDKHKLLQQTTQPKIIFVGGSNVSMGIDSKLVADSCRMPVVNTAIAIWLGLKFMLNDVKPYVKKGDIVVIAAEYACYDESLDEKGWNGSRELLAILFDIYPRGNAYLDMGQIIHLAKFLPHYTVSEINTSIAGHPKGMFNDMSVRRSFNGYGDLSAHWQQVKIPFAPEEKCNGREQVNPEAMLFLKDFNGFVKSKGAKLIVLPPTLQAQSFRNQQFIIKKIEAQLKSIDVPFSARPERYIAKDIYCNDSPYHLTRQGVAIRTRLVAEDITKTIDR